MTDTDSLLFLILDKEWRLLRRVEGGSDWRDIMVQLLQVDGDWIVIEQRREHDPWPLPKWDDIRLSRVISRRLRPMEVKLADHIIQGGSRRFSFREAGLL
ncbi:JAB domain-containing protein [Sphingobium mellinum]|uniref:JAB domain-containing protein n=1 Tax=Sphingobium mellinum TaxID=1387166 RepID=UPI0030ED520C